MYTLEELKQKNLKELKVIGWQLNVLPEGDRRCRQNWIKALVGVQPPLLQLLEVSPGVEPVQEAIEIQRCLALTTEIPVVEEIEIQELIEPQALASFQIGDLVKSVFDRWGIEQESLTGTVILVHPSGGVRVNFGPGGTFDYSCPRKDLIKMPTEEPQAQEPPLESKFGRIVYPRPAAKSEPKVSQSAIALAAKNSPGVKRNSTVHQLLELFNSSAHIIPNSPAETGIVTESAIGQTDSDQIPDRNPILTGITFSDKFLATYSPPNSKIVRYRADADGQLSALDFDVEETNEPPDPDYYSTLAQFEAVMNAWNAAFDDGVEQFRDLDPQQNNAELDGTDTEREGAREISIDAPATPRGDICSERDGASLARHDEGLGGQEGDRILEKSGADSGDSGRVISRQPTQLIQSHDSDIKLTQAPIITPQAPIITLQAPIVTPQAPIVSPQATFNDEQRPPGRGDGRGNLELAIGMLVGRRRDREHLGKILNIYQSRRGIWRAKIQLLNKPRFVYFDCSALIEQRLLYDYEMKPGGFTFTGEIFNKKRCEHFEVYSRKVRSAKPTNWTPGQLNQLSTFKLKQIARDMQILSVPGSAGKRSLIRAILAEQAISQERAAAQRENSSPTAQKQKPASVASRKKQAVASPLGHQLSLFDVAV